MIVKERHRVPAGVAGIRLSDYARTAFPIIASRKGAAKAIKRGELRVDGKVATTGHWVESGQWLELIDLQLRKPEKVYRLPLPVLWEDAHLAVINKPPGIEVSGNRFRTVENALTDSLQPSLESDALSWPRPVHRLDYSTSGLLLIAKTMRAHVALGRQFEARDVYKRYCAVVMGKPAPEGRIELPVNGNAAESRYQVRESVPSLRSGCLSCVDLFPKTGRTHQLRVHMAGIGHPMVGDQKYGEPGNVLKGKGLFLSAVELRFKHPLDEQEIAIEIEPPHKFRALLEREKRRAWSHS